MNQERWRPRCTRPEGLIQPVRLDPAGLRGPTRGQARSQRWTRVAHGWYVDATVRPDVVEQRILEQAARLGDGAAVSAWASLRWRGGGFFDGFANGGSTTLPVPLVVGPGSNMRANSGSTLSWEQLAPWEWELVDGVPCTAVPRALFDEVRRRSFVRDAVVAADMAIAADLISAAEFAAYVAIRPAWSGVPFARRVLPLIDGRSDSPQESRLRLCWILDAGLPPPLSNPDLITVHGEFLGRPDLLDAGVGLVGEYDGADHLRVDRRRHDRAREERFRDHGLEVVTVVRGELQDSLMVARRIRSAYRRARDTVRHQSWAVAR